MRKRKNLNQAILTGVVAFVFLFCFAYVQFDELQEMDLLSNPKFENVDSGNLLLDKQPKVLGSVFPSNFLPEKTLSVGCLSGPIPLRDLIPQKSLILRC